MSTYLLMWEKLRGLSQDDIKAWIRTIEPAEGRDITFYGIPVLDVDLLEGLRQVLD